MPYYKKLVSFSELELFDNCERRFFFEKIQKKEPPTNPTLVVGHVYHHVLANYWGHDLVGLKDVIEGALYAFRADIEKFKINVDELRNEVFHNVTRTVNEVLIKASLVPAPFPGPGGGLYQERRFENHKTGFKGVVDLKSLATPIVDAKGQVIGGAPDDPCVIDYKSLTSDRRRSERDARLSPQLALYAWETGVRNAAFVEIPRNPERDVRVRVVHYSEGETRNWISYLQAQRKALFSRGKREERYRRTARKNPLCSPFWCPHHLSCYEIDDVSSDSLTKDDNAPE